jgi:hypothetical protein
MSADQVERKFPRFGTDVKVSFKVAYDFRTEVDFKVKDEKEPGQEQTYIGFSKNISVNGLCFESAKQLKTGDYLWMELHLPKHGNMIYMEGEVRWSSLVQVSPTSPRQYISGILVKKVDGVEIDDTVYFDEEYKVTWSHLLERVLGGFAKLSRKASPSTG